MPTKCKVYVIKEAKGKWEYLDVTLDDPLDHEVLVKVKYAGICHTDISTGAGLFGEPFPLTVGHEGAGVVEKIGSKITHVKVGDTVLLSFAFCGECVSCKSDVKAKCAQFFPINFGRSRGDGVAPAITAADGSKILGTYFGQSSLGEYALALESSVVKVSPDTDLSLCCPLGCGIQTGAGTVLNYCKPNSSQSVLVMGAGTVGLSAVLGAASVPAKTIIVVDLVNERLELAKKLGATHVINGRKDVAEEVKKIVETGVDFAIEATGVAACAASAWKALGQHGKLCQVGASGPGPSLTIELNDVLVLAKSYVGVIEGNSTPSEFIPKLMALKDAGKLPLEHLITKYKPDQIEKALHDVHEGTTIKAVIDFSG